MEPAPPPFGKPKPKLQPKPPPLSAAASSTEAQSSPHGEQVQLDNNVLAALGEVPSRIDRAHLAAADVSNPDKTGILKKLSGGGILRSWQRRYFILKDAFLYYYKTESDERPYNYLNLCDYTKCESASEMKGIKKKGAFYLKNPGNSRLKVYVFVGNNEAESKEWMEAIQTNIKLNYHPNRHRPKVQTKRRLPKRRPISSRKTILSMDTGLLSQRAHSFGASPSTHFASPQTSQSAGCLQSYSAPNSPNLSASFDSSAPTLTLPSDPRKLPPKSDSTPIRSASVGFSKPPTRPSPRNSPKPPSVSVTPVGATPVSFPKLKPTPKVHSGSPKPKGLPQIKQANLNIAESKPKFKSSPLVGRGTCNGGTTSPSPKRKPPLHGASAPELPSRKLGAKAAAKGKAKAKAKAPPFGNVAVSSLPSKTTACGGAPSRPPRPSKPNSQQFSVGTRCTAQYYADNEWYAAQVDECLPNGHYLVTFVDYGNQEEVTPAQIKP